MLFQCPICCLRMCPSLILNVNSISGKGIILYIFSKKALLCHFLSLVSVVGAYPLSMFASFALQDEIFRNQRTCAASTHRIILMLVMFKKNTLSTKLSEYKASEQLECIRKL